jgi:sulfate/thiosulfate transport system substrate-binding protein
MTALLQRGGRILLFMFVLAAAGLGAKHAVAQTELLNVSYDPTRELYAALNPVFSADWKRRTGQAVTIRMSHGGTGAQAGAVIAGLDLRSSRCACSGPFLARDDASDDIPDRRVWALRRHGANAAVRRW